MNHPRRHVFGSRRRAWSAVAAVVLPAMAGAPAWAGQAPATGPAEALVARQVLVRERLNQLEDRLFRLARHPEMDAQQRRRLEEALRRSREMLIRRAMDQAVQALQQTDLSAAADRQEEAARALELVLDLLLSEPDPAAEHQAEQRRLAEMLQQIQTLLSRQRELTARTAGEASGAASASAPSDRPALAQAQRQLQRSTEALAAGGASDPSPNTSAPADTVPAGDELGQAAGHMARAAGRLEEAAPAEAMEDQQRAAEALEQAVDRLQRKLQAVREELRDLLRKAIQQRLDAMADRQAGINTATTSLDRSRTENGREPDGQALAALAGDQDRLAGQARDLLDMLADRDDVVALPLVLDAVRADMVTSARRLGRAQLGEVTAALQQRILDNLRSCLASLESSGPVPGAGEHRSGGQSEGNPGSGPPGLLPAAAELKLLRTAQVQLMTLTAGLEEIPDLSDEARAEALREASDRQTRLAGAARRMAKNLEGP